MQKTASKAKTTMISLCACLLLVAVVFGFAACGSGSLYAVDFSGTMGDNFKEEYQLEGTTWRASDEEGFEKVYTLTGVVPYNYDFATLPNMRYDLSNIYNFAVIHISSEDIARVAYNEETGDGFYAEIVNRYGTDAQEEPVIKHSSFGAAKDGVDTSHDYYLFQGIDDTVKTMTIEISFDGTEENARLFKFVIDPENYTLEEAPTQGNE